VKGIKIVQKKRRGRKTILSGTRKKGSIKNLRELGTKHEKEKDAPSYGTYSVRIRGTVAYTGETKSRGETRKTRSRIRRKGMQRKAGNKPGLKTYTTHCHNHRIGETIR